MKTLFASAVMVVVSVAASSARADAPAADDRKDKNVEVMIFDDDELLHSNVAPGTATIGAGHRPVRTILTRPRTHFVPEMLASIERL